ncbi:type I-F CRISPR-associated protein Csy1 [Bisgaard Taxon 46]
MSPNRIKEIIIRYLEVEKKFKEHTLDEDYLFNWIKNDLIPKARKSNFATHISKGIHPSSEGENITFRPESSLPLGYIGSQSVLKLDLDLSGNASHFPVAKFFSIQLNDEVTLKDLILENSPSLLGVFAEDLDVSEQYRDIFARVLEGSKIKRTTDQRNKQLLWCNNQDSIINDDYTCLIPLHPVSLLKEFHSKVRNKKQTLEISIPELARLAFGGQHPKNVSFFTNNQSGINYLLPSLPPISHSLSSFKLKLTDSSIFNKRLAYACRLGFRNLFKSTEIRHRNFRRKTAMLDAVSSILQVVLSYVHFLQEQEAGWSKAYDISWEEKYWLDPNRSQLEGENDFRVGYELGEWREKIEHKFTLWIIDFLQRHFPNLNEDFKKTDYQELRTKVTQLLRYQLRQV